MRWDGGRWQRARGKTNDKVELKNQFEFRTNKGV